MRPPRPWPEAPPEESEQTPPSPSGGSAVDVRVGRSRWRIPGVVALALCSAVAAFAGGRATSPPEPAAPAPAPTGELTRAVQELRSEVAALRAETAQRFEEVRSEQRATRSDVREIRRELREAK